MCSVPTDTSIVGNLIPAARSLSSVILRLADTGRITRDFTFTISVAQGKQLKAFSKFLCGFFISLGSQYDDNDRSV